jgi:ABC-type transport system substrate-binding protein
LKQYWDAVGLITDIDIADPGRFYGGLYGAGWDDLLLTGYGEGDMLGNFQNNLGDQPLTRMAASSYALPPELLALSKESRTYPDVAGQQEVMKRLTIWIADHDFVIPLWLIPGSFVRQPWLHITYLQEGGFSFYFGKYWMEAHK